MDACDSACRHANRAFRKARGTKDLASPPKTSPPLFLQSRRVRDFVWLDGHAIQQTHHYMLPL